MLKLIHLLTSGILASTACFWAGQTTETTGPVSQPNLLSIDLRTLPQCWISETPDGEFGADLDLAVMQDPEKYNPAKPWKNADFHIVSGPNMSTKFKGIHESDHPGTTIYSLYKEDPYEPAKRVWKHYAEGPSMSLFHREY